MISEKSCGAVVFTKVNGEIKYLLVKNLSGVYGFPKGHVEGDESELETAKREIFEETGLKNLNFIEGFKDEDLFPSPQKKVGLKQVIYFLAEFYDEKVVYPEQEILDVKLLDYQTAISLIKHDSTKRILTNANNFLLRKNS